MTSNLQTRVFATFERATKAKDALDSLPKLSIPQDAWVWGGGYRDSYFALNHALLYLCNRFHRSDYVVGDVEIAVKRLDVAIREVDSYVECRTRDFESHKSKV